MLQSVHLPFRVGTFNVLCPAYGVKWGEREACLEWKSEKEHGGSNWDKRWPALLRLLQSAPWDVLALQELEDSVRPCIENGLNSMGLKLVWFSHPGREDALGVAFNDREFTLEAANHRDFPPDDPKATSGLVDLRHKSTGIQLRCVVTHQRGGIPAQLADLFAFASDAAVGAVVVCGDFNEEFETGFQPNGFVCLDRDADRGEPVFSRPPHKQRPEQKSGKGKIDYIFAKGYGDTKVSVERDEESRGAICKSHAPCEETGEWPSDHGMEALSIVIVANVETGVDEKEAENGEVTEG